MKVDFKKPLDQVLNKEMTRQEFLAHVGAATAALIGVSGLIKTLSGNKPASRSGGYGASSYGGERKLGKISRRLG